MSFTLNSPKLLARDIQNFSKENSIIKENTDNIFVKLMKQIAKTVIQIITVNRQLNIASTLLKSAIKKDSAVLYQLDERSKEDVLIKWEALAHTLNQHTRNNPNIGSSILTRRIVNKSKRLILEVNCFVENLKNELYPNLNKPLSQEYLKKNSEKFQHLPQDVLDDLTSNEYSECL